MRLFGYYAWHAFVNQLRKLFKTWVLVFILVCALAGGGIGYFAAVLSDAAEEQAPQPEVIVDEIDGEEDRWQPDIPGDALLELAVGGVILAVFVYQAISADTNGSRIFLPADVNLLFASPMKPQSVLMFRLATQLGTSLIASIYLAFQLPNLILNLGMSIHAAVSLLLTWVAAIFIGKLLQVMLYTVCSTTPKFKAYLRRGIYALLLVLTGAFLVYFKASGKTILVAADSFFNFPGSRLIPFWGWLKGMCAYTAQSRYGMAGVCLAALIVGSCILIYTIWHLNADFYEDAMAKSEETAALMEKARAEKSTGVVATGKRKKDRKDSLLRDGMTHGWGANVFFFKTLYNRFRFAHLGIFTKTMETYLVAALGTAALTRFVAGSRSEVAVALTLGALVFFRAMGNPLEEDTGMDFFRLIPESTWQKLFFSLLGGTVNCLLDLVLPILAASALLMINPLKILVWLPLMVSLDFYASSVCAFIDLSIPVSVGKTIKQLIQILFIYFGLLPMGIILAVGIVFGHTAAAAAWSTLTALALGFLFFSLASVFLQPKGKDYTEAAADQDLSVARKHFSRLGLAIFTCIVILTALQLAGSAAAAAWFPGLLAASWGIWVLTFVPQYLAAVPAALAIMRRVPAAPPERKPLGFRRGVIFFFICIFMMYSGNLIGTLVTSLLGMLRAASVTNPLEVLVTGENLPIQILVVVILAPIIEEYVFRKQLIDRMRSYGGKTAVLVSALLFGLYHGNLSQFFYAFGLGLAFGYVYLNTGKLRYSIAAHMFINFLGSVFSVELLKRLPQDAALDQMASSPWVAVYGIYVVALLASAVTGLVLLCVYAGRLRFPAGSLELPKGTRLRTVCANVGMILVFLACAAMIALSLAV